MTSQRCLFKKSKTLSVPVYKVMVTREEDWDEKKSCRERVQVLHLFRVLPEFMSVIITLWKREKINKRQAFFYVSIESW